MKNIYAIFVKDMRSYFSSVIAYIVISIFVLLSGYFFFNSVSLFSLFCIQVTQQPYYQGSMNLTELVLPQFFATVAIIMLFMMPMLSMRSFAEEKKSGTVELLFTYPVRDIEIYIGKFVGVVSVFLVMMVPLLIYPLLIETVGGVVELKTYLTGLLGLLLVGISFLSLGMFVSALTENQIIAVVVSFGLLLMFWMIGWASTLVSNQLATFLHGISIIEHFKNFAQGLIDTQDILFYVLFTVYFAYLTLRILESRRWRG